MAHGNENLAVHDIKKLTASTVQRAFTQLGDVVKSFAVIGLTYNFPTETVAKNLAGEAWDNAEQVNVLTAGCLILTTDPKLHEAFTKGIDELEQKLGLVRGRIVPVESGEKRQF